MSYAITDKATDDTLVGRTIDLQHDDGTSFRALVEKHDGTEMVVCCVTTGTRFHLTKQPMH